MPRMNRSRQGIRTPLPWVAVGLLSLLVSSLVVSAPVVASVRGSATNPCIAEEPVASGLGDPFGFIDGIGTGGNAASNRVTVLGWALDDNGVAAVDILVDGHEVGRARLERARPDVARLFGAFAGAALSGFDYELDTTNFPNGEHVVTARVLTNTGQVTFLQGIVLDFQNNTHNLKPFGFIEFPDNNAAYFGTCNPLEQSRRLNVITGWALDFGVELNDQGVGYVELLLDGSILANSRRDCTNSLVTGLNTNCYGIYRPGVEARYPTARDAANAGFRFVVDVGALINFGWAEGNHVFTIRAADQDSQVVNIDSVNVNFICDNLQGDREAIGSIDLPPNERNAGVIQLTGWALDADGVDRVSLRIDGAAYGEAVYGFARPEVTTRNPGFPDSNAPGWAFTLDTRLLSDGPHSVQLQVTDDEGNFTLVGEIDLFVDNV